MSRRKYRYSDYNKSAPYEDATRIFIVYEGKSKEPNYFEAFNEKFIDRKKAFVCHILEEDTGVIGNTPLKIKERVQYFIENPPKNINITPANDDKFRFVFDVDKHPQSHIEELIRFSKTLNDSKIFISNYCFEVWLWSHLHELSAIKSASSRELKTELGEIQNLNYPHDFIKIELISKAIKRCSESDTNPANIIPDIKNSKVYLLMQELLEHSFVNITITS